MVEEHDQHGVPVADWEAPRIEHFPPPQQEQQAEVGRCYPQRVRHHCRDTEVGVKLKRMVGRM